MRNIALVVFIVTLSLISSIARAASASPETITRLVTAIGVERMMQNRLAEDLPALKQKYPKLPEKFWTNYIAASYLDILKNIIIPVYGSKLTEEEAKAAVSFYESAEGRAMVQKLPLIVQDFKVKAAQWEENSGARIFAEQFKKETGRDP